MAFQAELSHGKPTMVDHTPAAPVAAGSVVVTNDTCRVSHLDIPANTLGALASDGGVYRMIADGAIAPDRKVFWDAAAGRVTLTAGANKVFGVTTAASAAAGDVIPVRHAPELA